MLHPVPLGNVTAAQQLPGSHRTFTLQGQTGALGIPETLRFPKIRMILQFTGHFSKPDTGVHVGLK